MISVPFYPRPEDVFVRPAIRVGAARHFDGFAFGDVELSDLADPLKR